MKSAFGGYTFLANNPKGYDRVPVFSYIRKTYYEHIKTLDISFTDFQDQAIGEKLESYGKNEASLIREIQDHKRKAKEELRKAKSLEDLLGERAKEKELKSEEDLKTDIIMDELKNLFKKRIKNLGSYDELAFKDWINAPKNKDRCKRLGKDPFVVLKELESWNHKELKK